MTIYIISSNNSIHNIEALQYSINKYWKPNPRVVVLSYNQPTNFQLAKNVRVDSMGEDRGHNYVNENLINYFDKVEESHFIFSCDDFPLIRPVDVDMFDTLKRKMIVEGISRVAMNGHVKTKPYNTIEQLDGYNIVEFSQTADYRKSAVWSMWSKEYFMKYLHGTFNLWEWELDERSKRDGHRILGTIGANIVQACHLFKQSKLKANWFQDSEGLDEAYEEDKIVIQRFLDKWKKEEVPQLI
jgi:hypothetical protein